MNEISISVRILNIILHSTIYMIFASYPFKRSFRYKISVSLAIMAAYILVLTPLILSLEFPGTLPNKWRFAGELLFVALPMLFAYVLVKNNPFKFLFSNFFLLIVQMNNICFAKQLYDMHLFEDVMQARPLLNYYVYTIVGLLLMCPLLWYIYCVLLKRVEETDVQFKQWGLLFAVTLCMYVYCALSIHAGTLYLRFRPIDIGVELLLNYIVCTEYIIMLKLVLIANQNNLKQKENAVLENAVKLQKEYCANLQQCYCRQQQDRHDFKQKIFVLKKYAHKHDYVKINKILDEYLESHTNLPSNFYCVDFSINAMLNHYFTLFRERELELELKVAIKENISVSDADMCVIMGNLLDNALQASERVCEKQRAYTKLYIGTVGTQLIIMEENYYEAEREEWENPRKGIGLASIHSIVNENGGSLSIARQSNIFRMEILFTKT